MLYLLCLLHGFLNYSLLPPFALLGSSKHLYQQVRLLMLQENCAEPVVKRDNDSQTGSAWPSTMAPARRPPGRSIGMSTVVRLLSALSEC